MSLYLPYCVTMSQLYQLWAQTITIPSSSPTHSKGPNNAAQLTHDVLVVWTSAIKASAKTHLTKIDVFF
jgi:hypothetical protein